MIMESMNAYVDGKRDAEEIAKMRRG